MTAVSRGADFAPVVLAYVLCVMAGALVLVGQLFAPPWDAFWADVAATLVVFGFSRRYRNSSFYDPYWSVIPPLLALYWMWRGGAGADPRAWLVTVLVWLWAIRLTVNWGTF